MSNCASPITKQKAVAALFGATPLGIAGALLQWLTLAILVAIGLPDLPLSLRLVIAPLGAMMLLAGVVLALRGGSLGPLIVIPGIIGVAMVVLLTISDSRNTVCCLNR